MLQLWETNKDLLDDCYCKIGDCLADNVRDRLQSMRPATGRRRARNFRLFLMSLFAATIYFGIAGLATYLVIRNAPDKVFLEVDAKPPHVICFCDGCDCQCTPMISAPNLTSGSTFLRCEKDVMEILNVTACEGTRVHWLAFGSTAGGLAGRLMLALRDVSLSVRDVCAAALDVSRSVRNISMYPSGGVEGGGVRNFHGAGHEKQRLQSAMEAVH